MATIDLSQVFPGAVPIGKESKKEITKQVSAKKRIQREAEKAQIQLAKELEKESQYYAALIVSAWTRMDQAHIAKQADISTGGRAPRKRKIQQVKFSHIFTGPEQIFYKIAINKRTLFGLKNILPFNVWVRDLTSDETLFELSMACERTVTAVINDSRKGAWIIVNRLQGVDGIPTMVSYGDMLEHYPEDTSRADIVVGVGKHRKVHHIKLADFPHALIGGSTGSGKSNMVNNIICSLIRHMSPDELKLILIDFKQLEFAFYEDVPHLLKPVIYKPQETVEVLRYLIKTIDERQTIMKGKARELSEWNEKFPPGAPERLSRIVAVVDEFAEIVFSDNKDIADESINLITRISNIGRAIGVHMIVCTQRPAVEVLPMKIKGNMPLILAGRTPTVHHSRVILDDGGAASLPNVKGRMLYRANSADTEIQPPLITDYDVKLSVRIAKGSAKGFIRFRKGTVTVYPEKIILHIYDELKGILSPGKLWNEFKQYAVPANQLKALLADLIKKKQITIGDRTFEVDMQGKHWQLFELYEPDSVPSYQTDTDLHKHTLERFKAMLPAPVLPLLQSGTQLIESGNAIENEQPIISIYAEPVQDTEPEEKSMDEIINEYIANWCIVQKGRKCQYRIIYRAYRVYCARYAIEPISQQMLSRELKKRGFTTKRGHRGKAYAIGITFDTSIDIGEDVEQGEEKSIDTYAA